MRLRLVAVLLAGIAAVLGATSPVQGQPACVQYTVTAPFLGTRQGTRCVPEPNAFDLTITVSNCQGIPPIGVSECLIVTVQLPSP